MSKIAILRCIKHHLNLGDYFLTTFVTWDEKLGKIRLIGKNKSKIVHAGTILQLAVIAARIWSVVTKATSLIETVIGIAITSLTTIAFLLRFEISADYLPVQFLNFVFSTKDLAYTPKEKMFLTCLRVFMDLVAFGCFTMASIYGLLSVLLPCQPGLVSSLICTEELVLAFSPGVLIPFAFLEFIVYMQVGLGGMYYILSVLLTGVTFLWIECGTFIRNFEAGLTHQIEYRKVQMFEKILNACTRNSIFLKTALLTPSLQLF
ncbi:uncharacterized protein LOC118436725 [Folsomia candida]|uniref:uncharacterized protein LOC118436725 n=1 Tax=Folsomia candida TaxID=158441 RepID=UPI0016051EA0|nr:uncharacterized protein LOC118436725 [Folsomia candida]